MGTTTTRTCVLVFPSARATDYDCVEELSDFCDAGSLALVSVHPSPSLLPDVRVFKACFARISFNQLEIPVASISHLRAGQPKQVS